MSANLFNATVVRRLDLHEELSIVCVRPDSGSVPDFEPGQFAVLALPREAAAASASGADSGVAASRPRLIRRAYSIASSPKQRDLLELLVVLVERGKLTPRLWTVEPGGRVWLDDRIKGDFTLEGVPRDKDVLLVATGTGLAPYISMLRAYRGGLRWRRVVVIHGVRKTVDLAYRGELEALSREGPSVVYVPIISREPEDSEWPGLRGRVQAVFEDGTYRRLVGASLDPQVAHVFLCGNPEMIKSMQALLEGRGFRTHTKKNPGNIHFERYW